MAQYEKLINLSLLNQFLTKAKTIFAPKITASGILKGDGAGNVSAATAGADYLAPNDLTLYRTAAAQDVIDAGKEASGLGLTGASVGDLVRVNAVDANGKPTSWKKVALNEIKCNKNLLDNWYFVGGGSQLGDGVFPINQRGQTTYSGAGYGIDRWKNGGSGSVVINENGLTVSGGGSSSAFFLQVLKRQIPTDVVKTFSILDADGNLYTSSGENILVTNAPFGGYRIEDSGKKASIVVTANKFIKIAAVKLELGSEQTLCHNEGTEENPVWVLNEIPDYGEELRKCKLYFERIGGTYSTFGDGAADSNNAVSFLTYVSPKSSAFTGNPNKVPNNNISASGDFFINGSGISGKNAPVTNMLRYKELKYNGIFRFQVDTSGSLTTGYGYSIQSKDTAAYIDISCEP